MTAAVTGRACGRPAALHHAGAPRGGTFTQISGGSLRPDEAGDLAPKKPLDHLAKLASLLPSPRPRRESHIARTRI
jgi:hypothetical protein